MKPTNSGEGPAAVAHSFLIGPEFSNIGAGGFSGAQQTVSKAIAKLRPAVSWPGFLPEGAAHSSEPLSSPMAISKSL